MNAMLLMMGGSGTRFGASRPKQYTLIEDIPLFAYIIRKVDTLDDLDRLVLVSHEDWVDYVEEWCRIYMHRIPYNVVSGGETRSESVLHGLECLSAYAENEDVVLIHDATHPYIDEKGIHEVVEAVHEYGGATLASGNYDTVYEQDENGFLRQVLQRTNVVAGASPEAFRFGEIYRIYKSATPEELEAMTSAGAIALAHRIPMKVVPARYLNLKITYQRDMDLFLKLYDSYFFDETQHIAHEKADVLRRFDQFCRENGLEYFMYVDLLVGSAHYGDVAPGTERELWRLGMRRKDYDRMIVLLPEAETTYGLRNNQKDLGIRSSELCLRKEVNLPETEHRIVYEICIMPYDNAPPGEDEKKYFLRRAKWRSRYLDLVYDAKASGEGLSRKILRHFPTQFVYRHLVKDAQKYRGLSDADEFACVVGFQSGFLSRESLYPLAERPFHGLMLFGPNRQEIWTTVMCPEVQNRIAQIQKVDLLLLEELDRVCKQLGIGYFLCGGSMVGYVRHGGFVPWDDDVDVGMLRKDYDILLREGGKHLDTDRFFLQTRESDPEIPYLFSKIRVNQTEYITTYNERRNFHKGICLDLFPFDVLPDDAAERAAFTKKVEHAVKWHNFIVNRRVPEPEYDSGPRSAREAWMRFRGKCNRGIYKRFSLKRTQQRYLKAVTRYNDRELTPETTVASFVPTYTYIKIKDLLPYEPIDFEGVPSSMIHAPEVFLAMQYGDYMQYPPKHQQMGHDLIHWSAEIPSSSQKL